MAIQSATDHSCNTDWTISVHPGLIVTGAGIDGPFQYRVTDRWAPRGFRQCVVISGCATPGQLFTISERLILADAYRA